MSDEIATLSIQRPCSTPVAALRATEKRSFPISLNGQLETFDSDAKISRKQSPAGVREAPPEGVVWFDFHSSLNDV